MDSNSAGWDGLLQWLFSPWVYAPLLFLGWILAAFIVKGVLIRHLKKLASKTSIAWDDVLVRTLSGPLNILVVAAGVLLLNHLLPLSAGFDRSVVLGFQLAVLLACILFLDRFLRGILDLYNDQIRLGLPPNIMRVFLRTVLFGSAALIFLDNIGVSITPVLASLGIGSLAVGLALQDTLQNFFSGVYISFDRPIRIGDYIKLDSGEEGYVAEIGWRSTRIKMLPNNIVVVPNHKLTSANVTNFYLPEKELAVLVQVGVHYGSDLAHVEKVTCEVAKEIMTKVPGGVPTFDPFIRYHTFDSSSINFSVIMRGKEFVDQHLIKHEFIKALQARYKKEGIVIPYPIRTLDIPLEAAEALKRPASGKP